MTRRRHANCPSGLLCLFAVLCARTAIAERAPCGPLVIEADASVTSRWPGMVDRLHATLDGRDDVDHGALVTLSSHGGAVMVDVALPDGRSATRSASRPEDVATTLEALLLLPERDVARPTSSPVPSATAPVVASTAAPPKPSPPRMAPAANDGLVARDRESLGRSPADLRTHLRIELSLLGGARIGDGQSGTGLGALSFVDVHGWLFGVEGRVDRYRRFAAGDEASAFEVALLAGRRFPFDNLAFDVAAGAAATLLGTTTFETRSTADGTHVNESTSSTVPRLLVDSRLSIGARSPLRAFVAIDGEVGPRRMGSTDVPGATRLPLWTLGLAVGATVGTQ